MADHRWRPSGPLPDRSAEAAPAQSLYDEWRDAEKKLRRDDPEKLMAIKRQLIRRMIIEIGLLENLYELDRATTETLVARGFDVALVPVSSTNMEPARLIAMLRNQEAAIAPLADDPDQVLTKDIVRRIHAIQMQHQDTVATTDLAGHRKLVPLLKGHFKTTANNLTLADGSVHEFCPAETVEQELDTLLARLPAAGNADPTVAAAWMHYSLYQLHPFQTGNGRVVRAVTAHMMLQAGLLPIVVEREDRASYKAGMAKADDGDLVPLAALFSRAAHATIHRALDQARS